MEDLISRSALLNIVEPRLDYLRDKNGSYDHYTDGYEECYDRIDEAPTVDAVEVVRCKFCCHSITAYEGAQRYCISHYGEKIAVEEMGFCSRGERSADESRNDKYSP